MYARADENEARGYMMRQIVYYLFREYRVRENERA